MLALARMLETLGYECDKAISGDIAINKIKENWIKCKLCSNYKIILMDIDMPEKNGFETTQEIVLLCE